MPRNFNAYSAKRKALKNKALDRSATNSDIKTAERFAGQRECPAMPRKLSRKAVPKPAIDVIHESVRTWWGCTIPINSPDHEAAVCAAWEVWRLANPRLLKRVARAYVQVDPYDGQRSLRVSIKGGI